MKRNTLSFMVTSNTQSLYPPHDLKKKQNKRTRCILVFSNQLVKPLKHDRQSRLKKVSVPWTVYCHRSWNQSGSPVSYKNSPCSAGGEKDVNSPESDLSPQAFKLTNFKSISGIKSLNMTSVRTSTVWIVDSTPISLLMMLLWTISSISGGNVNFNAQLRERCK